jgi:hypothetical protein
MHKFHGLPRPLASSSARSQASLVCRRQCPLTCSCAGSAESGPPARPRRLDWTKRNAPHVFARRPALESALGDCAPPPAEATRTRANPARPRPEESQLRGGRRSEEAADWKRQRYCMSCGEIEWRVNDSLHARTTLEHPEGALPLHRDSPTNAVLGLGSSPQWVTGRGSDLNRLQHTQSARVCVRSRDRTCEPARLRLQSRT